MWQIEDRMELFAYRAAHDGVCYIERIPLPNRQVAVVCAPAPGNPGTSITNAVEAIATQVCARFDIRPERLVWLEHWPTPEPRWCRVVFRSRTVGDWFAEPEWIDLTDEMWKALKLKPVNHFRSDSSGVPSLLEKRFRELKAARVSRSTASRL